MQGYPQTLRMMGIFGFLWLAILAIPVDPSGISGLVGLYAVCYVLVVAGATGNSFRERLVSPFARTIPNYLRAHLTVALGLCAVTSIVSAGIGAFRGLPLAAFLLFLWSCALLALMAGYVVPAVAVNHSLFWVVATGAAALALVLSKFEFNDLLAERMGSAVKLILFLVNASVTIFAVRRMLRLNEEDFGYLRYDPAELTRSQVGEAARRPSPALDSIQGTLPADLRSQLRHLQLGLAAPLSYWRMACMIGFLAIALFLFSFVSGKPTGISFETSLFMSGGVLAPLLFAHQHLQRFFTLPLPRRELVAKGGIALLLVGLRGWCVVAAGLALSDWSMHTVESLWTSLLLQLPIFGIVTLGMSVRKSLRKRDIVFIVPAILAVGMLAMASAGFPSQVRNAVYAIGGSASIALSYYRWCNAELD